MMYHKLRQLEETCSCVSEAANLRDKGLHCVPMIRIEYDTKKTAPFENDDAMTLSGLLAVSLRLSPVKMPSRLVKRAVPAQKAMTVTNIRSQ